MVGQVAWMGSSACVHPQTLYDERCLMLLVLDLFFWKRGEQIVLILPELMPCFA